MLTADSHLELRDLEGDACDLSLAEGRTVTLEEIE
jgi:hypothetical protein